MAGKPSSVHVIVLAGCLVLMGLMASARAAPVAPRPSPSVALFSVDIPAQPLADALQRYGSQVRRPALYRAEMVNGQFSTAVHGHYTAEDALRLLLEGSGLVAEKFATGAGSAFVLKLANVPAAAASGVAALGALGGYPAVLQSRVWQALCDDSRSAPGSYRALLRFQVDSTGQVQRPRLIASSGDAQRDAALLDSLGRVRMDSAPPPDLAQPVTLLLLPHEAGFGLRCASGGEAH